MKNSTFMKNSLPIKEELTEIVVRGAREHNLRNISLEIPRDKLVVVTGISGSGKSTLAFDTLYAEGQRRYVECLSQYAKQFIGVMKKPDVDIVEGLSPAISIEQKSISHNPRSTVGTVTEIYDYLRLLYSRIGVQYCNICDIPVVKKSDEIIKNEILEKYSGQNILILSPNVRGRKGHYRELFEQFMKQGFTKIRLDGVITSLTPALQANRFKSHDIDIVIDKCKVEESQYHRLSESCDLALKMGEGVLIIAIEQNKTLIDELFSTHNSCPKCDKSFQTLSPNMFSFNSQYGACSNCHGIGDVFEFYEDTVIINDELSIRDGAVAIMNKDEDERLFSKLCDVCNDFSIPLTKKWKNLYNNQKHILLHESHDYHVTHTLGNKKLMTLNDVFHGILQTLKMRYTIGLNVDEKRLYENYMQYRPCKFCNGGRLKPENLAVRIDGKNIKEATAFDIVSAIKHYKSLLKKLSERKLMIANLVLKEIIIRLEFLSNVGLSYLSLSRSVRTLSGGETQRIRLASQIGSQLVGVMYVLDEPSIGLHQHDNNKLIDSLKKLRDLGNSVIVVEHDKAMIESADYIVDLGPGAGIHGGDVVLSAAMKDIQKMSNGKIDASLTAQYIKNIRKIDVPKERRKPNGKFINLIGAKGNNLKNVTLNLPLGMFVCITGMSGSGKSSLINNTLYPILSNRFYRSISKALPYKEINGLENIDKVIEIDQSPIGRTPRSNPATYTGIFTQIRDFFAQLTESKVRGYKAGRFSFNVKGGRCEECEGAGLKKIEMNFLPDVYVICDLCNGGRYNDETLQVKYKDKSIADVLEMTVEEANNFFAEIPKISKKLSTLFEVGLGYIKLGQQAPTLSGGEAQRVKLATELSKISTGKTLYLLDEPTTGLHFEDVRILLELLHKLVGKGNTIIVIEHNLDVIKTADWIIDLGPEGGARGGKIIAEGSPEEIVALKKGYTAKYLANELAE